MVTLPKRENAAHRCRLSPTVPWAKESNKSAARTQCAPQRRDGAAQTWGECRNTPDHSSCSAGITGADAGT